MVEYIDFIREDFNMLLKQSLSIFQIKKLFYNLGDSVLSDLIDLEKKFSIKRMRYYFEQIERQFIVDGYNFKREGVVNNNFILFGVNDNEEQYAPEERQFYVELLSLYSECRPLYYGELSGSLYKKEERNRLWWLYRLLCFLYVYRTTENKHDLNLCRIYEVDQKLYFMVVDSNRTIKNRTPYKSLDELLNDYSNCVKYDYVSLEYFNKFMIKAYKEDSEILDEIDLYSWSIDRGWVINEELNVVYCEYIKRQQKRLKKERQLKECQNTFRKYKWDIRRIAPEHRDKFIDIYREEQPDKYLLYVLGLDEE